MYCSKCGTKNLKDADYCISCGEKITKPKTRTKKIEANEAGIRKAIKADAKSKIKGYFVGITALYFGAIIIISIITNGLFDIGNISHNNEFLDNFQTIITLFFASILYYCFANTAIKLSKGKTSNFSESLNNTFSNMPSVLVIFAVYAIIFALGYLLGYSMVYIPFLGFILSVAFIVLMFYYAPTIEMAVCMLSDEKYNKLSFNEIFNKAIEMTKGHRVEYYGLIISFIPWMLLIILTLGIILIWLIPYMRISVTNLYIRLDNQANFDQNSKGLSNGGVIGLVISICVVLITIVSLIFTTIIILYYAISNVDNEKIENIFDKITEEIETDIDSDLPVDIRGEINFNKERA